MLTLLVGVQGDCLTGLALGRPPALSLQYRSHGGFSDHTILLYIDYAGLARRKFQIVDVRFLKLYTGEKSTSG